MKRSLVSTLAVASILGFAAPAIAENLVHVQQLLGTGQCSQCDLSRSGLVMAELRGADLTGADLSQANLTRANLTNANLSGANLAGAVLFGANLTGANLTGANLAGADLREAYLTDANLTGTVLEGAGMLGAIGVATEIATPEQYYLWGMEEIQRGNFRGAINYYNQALNLKPEFAHAILARGVARFRLQDVNGALVDARQAEQLYITQENEEGFRLAVQFGEGVEATQEAIAEGNRPRGGGGNFLNFLGSMTGLLLRFML